MEVISVKNVFFKYNDEQIYTLKGINFNINSGEFVTIVGQNGSGKSTIAKVLMGLLVPQKGSIKIFDLDLNEKNVEKIRLNMALVFQNPDNQFIGSTVEDDIAFGLENRLVPTKEMSGKILKYAKAVGMDKFLNKEPTMLSGGQKQRVAIAGALALEPKILILDEATSMLDPKGKNEIQALLQEIRKNNKELTIISITHDIEESFNSDRVILVNDGKVILDGSPLDVLKKSEILAENHLEEPFILQIKNSLKKQGIEIKSNSLEEMVDEICLLK